MISALEEKAKNSLGGCMEITRDADQPAADQWILEKWHKLIETHLPDDVFNADETGLYFHVLHEHTLQNESKKGCRTPKEHTTDLCCISINGRKENF